ncbi:hypothetical protein [Uliginosibacterium flavum]|uniref:Uncharacterized protein n=1 Tax=Uliginosibacterium flavum TaxID=1396831 RepID=A0ABV2TLG1_9RHOO
MLEEFLVVFAHSPRTQRALWLGVLSFALVLFGGDYLVSNFSVPGMMAPLVESIREPMRGFCIVFAFIVLGQFLIAAFKSYIKDRKRLFDY